MRLLIRFTYKLSSKKTKKKKQWEFLLNGRLVQHWWNVEKEQTVQTVTQCKCLLCPLNLFLLQGSLTE